MKYQHPQIQIEQPAPGHYSVSGIPAHQVFIEGQGHVVAPNTLYVSPGVPDELLESILADRKAQRRLDGGDPPNEVVASEPKDPVLAEALAESKGEHTEEKFTPISPKRRGRPSKKPHTFDK